MGFIINHLHVRPLDQFLVIAVVAEADIRKN